MNDKNQKLLLPFPVEELKSDMETQRAHIERNMKFKDDFLNLVESKKMLFRTNIETGLEEVNGDVLNAIMNLNDNIDTSFKTLIEAYSKIAMSSSTMEKAYKENNNEPKVKETKPDRPVGKGVF